MRPPLRLESGLPQVVARNHGSSRSLVARPPRCAAKRRLTGVWIAIFVLGALCGTGQGSRSFGQNSDATAAPTAGSGQATSFGPPPSDGPVVVQVSFQLQDVDGIDDEEEEFGFTGVLTLIWLDPRQAFDPQQVGTAEKVFQGEYQVYEVHCAWYPQVVLVNESGLYDNASVLLRVKPDGTSTMSFKVNAVAEASLNLRRYPFDRQTLEARFEVLGFDKREVILESLPVSIARDGTPIRIPEWTLKGVEALVRDRIAPYSEGLATASVYALVLDVKRDSQFMMRLVIIPLVLIVIMSWSVFWMDRSSLGDRIGVSFVGILTAVAYQIVVGDIMPQISYITWIDAFLNISFWVMCCTVVVNLIVGDADKHGNTARGDLVDQRCRWIFPIVYFSLLGVTLAIAFIFF